MVNDEHNLPLKAVQEQLSAFHRTLNSINTPIYAVDSFYCYTNFNQSHIAVMKALYNVGIEIKHSILDYITVAENRVTIRRNIDRALHGEHIVEDTCLGEKPACRYFQESYNPIENDKGEIIGVAVLAQDITDRKLADEKFKVNEQQVQQKLESIIPPDADVSMLELADILDSENIQKLMNEFYQLTHIGIGIIDLHGKVLVGTGWQDICTKFHRVNPESCELCVESDLELSRNVPASTFKLYRCKNNMWDIATPIMLGNRHVGNIFLGQFLFDDEVPDYEIFRQQARRYGFDEQEYLAALDRVPRWSRDTVNAAISFYEAFAGMIGNLSYSNVKLANALKERKRAEEALKESEERLRVTMEATQIGVWDWDVKNDVWYASPTYYTMLGYEPVAGSSDRTLWLTRVHPDDRQAVADKINTVLKGHGTVYQYEARMKHADGSYRWHSVIGSLVQKDENDLPARLMGVRIDINDRKHAEEALLQSEQYKTILNQIANVFLTVPDEEIYGKVLEIVLKIMKSKFGVFGFIDTNGDLVIPSLTRDIWSECQVFDKSTIFPSATWGKSLWGKSIREKRAFLSDGPFHTPAGHITIDQFLTAPIVFANETIGLISVANNECGYTETDKILLENIVNFISPILNARLQRDHKEQERMQAENELSRVNRALQILSDTNHALIHIIDEKTLLKEVCNIAVSVGGYRMVWVGFAEHDEAKNLLPIAYAGYDSGYIESARMSWGDNERGHSPCGISVRTGMPCLVRNILDDPLFTLWRDIAIQHNYKSILALPLISEEQTFGTIGIYSDETDAFDEKEFSILKELADDLAFGITALRMRVKRDKTVEELKKSEEKFRTLIQKIQAAVVVYGPDTQILTSNSKAQELLGLTEKQNQGKTTSDSAWHFFLEDGTIMPVEKYPVNQVIATHQSLMNFVVGVHRPDNNNDVWTLVNADPVFNNYDEIQQVIVTFTDITERKRYESIMQARLRLLEYANSHSLEELLTATLDEMEALTRSKIGFYHFVEADQQTLTLQNWSSNTLKNMCSAEGKGSHYDISTAGVWVDCVYERRPVIHNNYAALSHRKGLPQGHAPVIRELVVPIFRGNIIKAIIGVGNKDTDYNDNDISIVSQLGDLSWDITERKLAENELQATNELLRAIIEAAPTAIIGLDLEGKVQMVWNPSAEHLLGWRDILHRH